jgi:hypothetical protein
MNADWEETEPKTKERATSLNKVRGFIKTNVFKKAQAKRRLGFFFGFKGGDGISIFLNYSGTYRALDHPSRNRLVRVR